MSTQNIRPTALCVFYHHHRILVIEFTDTVTNSLFYRPVGGGIEFGEPSVDTLVREIREELGFEIVNPIFLGTLENIFTVDGRQRHEIVQVYDAAFSDPTIYEQETLKVTEANGQVFKAVWKELQFFENSAIPLYPNGLFQLIQQYTS